MENKFKKYDVFISYKETDEHNEFTKDFYIADNIFAALNELNINVFFSKKTLKEHYGESYEDIIDQALENSKIMIVIGTQKKYFETYYVRKETDKFIECMNKEKSMDSDFTRYIIPCYEDLTKGELPSHLKDFQALDLKNDNYREDIVKRIKHLLKNRFEINISNNVISNVRKENFQSTNLAIYGQSTNLAIYGITAIEARNFEEADKLFKEALKFNVNNILAYVGICMLATTTPQQKEVYIKRIDGISSEITKLEIDYILKNEFFTLDYIALFVSFCSVGRVRYCYEKYQDIFKKPIFQIEEGVYGSPFLHALHNIKTTQVLLESGANPNEIQVLYYEKKDKLFVPFISILSYAVFINVEETVKKLLEYGAKPSESYRFLSDGRKYSALSDAISNSKNPNIVRLLLEYGANPNEVDDFVIDNKIYKQSMLFYAITIAKNIDIIELLLKYGASWDTEINYKGIKQKLKYYPFSKVTDINYTYKNYLKSKGWRDRFFGL